MIKILYCITKKAGMGDDEFHRYWREIHGPIAAKIPGVRKYVQSHSVPVSFQGRQSSYDGVAELWFDDMDSLTQALASPQAARAMEDERNFIDHNHVALMFTEEYPIV